MRRFGDRLVAIFGLTLGVGGILEVVTNSLVPVFDESPVEIDLLVRVELILGRSIHAKAGQLAVGQVVSAQFLLTQLDRPSFAI